MIKEKDEETIQKGDKIDLVGLVSAESNHRGFIPRVIKLVG